MKNILSIDYEDWHQAYRIRYGCSNTSVSNYLETQVNRLLEILDEYGIKATFFCLGKTVKEKPEIIRLLSECGHDVQSHGYGHNLVYTLGEKKFGLDISASKKHIEDITGQEVIGYRAPEFSINHSAIWAFKVLSEKGYKFDSSVFPFRGVRYGWPGFSKNPIDVIINDQECIREFPLVTTDLFGCTLPVAGGGYFRLLPRIVISFLLKRSSVSPKVFYFHPYEFSNNILSIREAVATIGLVKNIKISLFQNLFRKSIVGKVRRLLKQGKFITMGECYGNTKPESAVLLSSLGS